MVVGMVEVEGVAGMAKAVGMETEGVEVEETEEEGVEKVDLKNNRGIRNE